MDLTINKLTLRNFFGADSKKNFISSIKKFFSHECHLHHRQSDALVLCAGSRFRTIQTQYLCGRSVGFNAVGFAAGNCFAIHRHQRHSTNCLVVHRHFLACDSLTCLFYGAVNAAQKGSKLLSIFRHLLVLTITDYFIMLYILKKSGMQQV